MLTFELAYMEVADDTLKTVEVKSVEHAKTVLKELQQQCDIDYAEVYVFVDSEEGQIAFGDSITLLPLS